MSDTLTRGRALLLAIAALWIAGCDASSTRSDQSTDSKEQSAGRENVTFYVAGMNERLKIY